MENWKTIEDFEQYEVSDLGRVRRKQATCHHPGKVFLKPWVGTGGYLQLQLEPGIREHVGVFTTFKEAETARVAKVATL